MLKRFGDACAVLCSGTPPSNAEQTRRQAPGPGTVAGRSLTGVEPAFCWRTYRDTPITAGKNTKIEFFTDVEGSWDYFLRFTANSEVLYWGDDERGVWGPGTLMLHEDCVLVFGGDTSDKGPGDIRFVKTMLSLKQRFPDRVGLILGNRDINKLRFWSELAEGEDPTQFRVYWDAKAAHFEAFMKKNTDGNGLKLGTHVKGPLAYLHWMLNCNMGCQVTTFGNRRLELALINGSVTDDDVVESYRQCANPNGEDPWMLDYLRLGKLALVVNDTLFIHADAPERCLGVVPEIKEALLPPRSSGNDWVDALNSWKDRQLEEYRQLPTWVERTGQEGDQKIWSCSSDGGRTRGGVGLIDYGVPKGFDAKSVTYNNPFANGNSQLVTPAVEEIFQKWNIRRVLSGHQPHGQSPTVVRHPQSGLLRITADTSYSCMQATKLFNKSENRGDIISLVQLQGDLTRIWGTMADCKHDTLLHSRQQEDDMPDALVGRQLKSGAWVKAAIVPEQQLSRGDSGKIKDSPTKQLKVCQGIGFKIDMHIWNETQCCMMLKEEFSLRGSQLWQKFRVNYSSLRGSCLLSGGEISGNLEDSPDPDGKEAPDPMAITRKSSFINSQFDGYDTYLFAPQGVLYSIHDPIDMDSPEELTIKVVTKLNHLMKEKRVLFVSNNARDSRKQIAERLQKIGIQLPKEKPEQFIISSAFTCAWFLKKAEVKKPFILSSHRGLLDELESLGITNYVATVDDKGNPKPEYLGRIENGDSIMKLLDPDVDCVVTGWDQQVSTLKIAVAAMYLRLNPDMQIVTCSMDPSGVFGVYDPVDADTSRPVPDKYKKKQVYAVGNGVIAQSVCTSAGRRNDHAINVGKPSLIMLDHLKDTESFNVDLSRAVMIGDTVSTDMKLAHEGGMKGVLVFSGVTSADEYEDLPVDTKSHISLAISSFADL